MMSSSTIAALFAATFSAAPDTPTAAPIVTPAPVVEAQVARPVRALRPLPPPPPRRP